MKLASSQIYSLLIKEGQLLSKKSQAEALNCTHKISYKKLNSKMWVKNCEEVLVY